MTLAGPAIGAVAPWFGGKRTLASRIVAELGPHKAYVEPFCGSCSVLFAKPQTAYETVNDLHVDLVHLLKCLQCESMAQGLYELMARTVMSEAMLADAAAWLERHRVASADELVGLDLMRAAQYLIQSWMSRNGTAGTVLGDAKNAPSLAARFTFKGGSPSVRWASMVDSIPWWHQRLRSVVVLSRDAFDVLDKLPDEDGLAIYADPPYLADTRTSIGRGGSGSYLHDFEHEGGGVFGGRDDHARLAEALARFKRARVVVSYYAHPRLAELYPAPRWTSIDCSMNKYTANAAGRDGGTTAAPEVLLVNGPSLSGAGVPLLGSG